MSDTIDFYFDLSSPYGYLASCRADEIENETGKTLIWIPYLMGAVFKETGRQPLVTYPLVSDYAYMDIARAARKIEAPFTRPEKFPVMTAAACRACYWAESERKGACKDVSLSLYHAYFVDNRDISKPDTVLDVLENLGFDRDQARAAINSDAIKELARKITSRAIERGIFGSPFFVVEEEAFWGNDRVDDLILWCQKGGW